jgi:murein L,D-transpeptidase YafK
MRIAYELQQLPPTELRALDPMLAYAFAALLLQPTAPMQDLRIEIFKARRQLIVYSGERRLKTYRVGLGLDPVRRKSRRGDHATPEGRYRVCRKNPASAYYLSLALTYPNAEDAEQGLAAGLISRAESRRIRDTLAGGGCPPWNTALGGEIFIHGRGSRSDWTWGCIALDDPDIRELYRLVPLGTPVAIFP